MLRKLVVLVVLLAAVPIGAAPSEPVSCGGPVFKSRPMAAPGHVFENLLFAHGSLWISDPSASAIRRLQPDGTERPGVTGISPGGLVEGLDGKIYAGSGNGAADSIRRAGASKIIRFDTSDPQGTVQTVASGLDMANGLTQGPDGTLYVSNDFGEGPHAVSLDGSVTKLTDVYSANGLVVRDGVLYAALTFDGRAPIEAIPLASPGAHYTAAQLALGGASLRPAPQPIDTSKSLNVAKGLDDMTADDAGNLYVVGNGSGELFRVDPATGSSCLVASGLTNPSSVRIAPDWWTGGSPGFLHLYVTGFDGTVTLIVAPQA